MKKKVLIMFTCCLAVLSLCLTLCGFSPAVAYAAETPDELIVGQEYVFSDDGGEYSVTILSESEYKLHAVRSNSSEELDYKGTYTYIDGKLTLIMLDDTLGVFTLQGTTLVGVVESVETPEENHTFLGRVQAWLEANYVELATTLGDVVLLIVFLINFFKNKKDILGIKKGVTFTSNAQSDVVDVTNNLIGAYNKLEAEFNEYKKTESQNYETIGSMILQTRTILDILTTVYANSKNLPQGVKDLVNLKYADVLKVLGDTKGLKDVVTDFLASDEQKSADGTEE